MGDAAHAAVRKLAPTAPGGQVRIGEAELVQRAGRQPQQAAAGEQLLAAARDDAGPLCRIGVAHASIADHRQLDADALGQRRLDQQAHAQHGVVIVRHHHQLRDRGFLRPR